MFRWLKSLFILLNLLFATISFATTDGINESCHEHEEICVDGPSTAVEKVANKTQDDHDRNHKHDDCASCHHSNCGLRNANLDNQNVDLSCPVAEMASDKQLYKTSFYQVDSDGPFWPPKA